jgi:hypothetical protein
MGYESDNGLPTLIRLAYFIRDQIRRLATARQNRRRTSVHMAQQFGQSGRGLYDRHFHITKCNENLLLLQSVFPAVADDAEVAGG